MNSDSVYIFQLGRPILGFGTCTSALGNEASAQIGLYHTHYPARGNCFSEFVSDFP